MSERDEKRLERDEKQLGKDDVVIDSSIGVDGTEDKLEQMLEEKKQEQQYQPAEVPSAWEMSDQAKRAVAKSMAVLSTEFGLYASIPMVCKGEDCIYAQLYPELHEGLSEVGQRCPVEVALIMSKYDAYKRELDIHEDDAVDMSILRDVIDYDVQIVRAENKMAIEGDFVKDVVVGVNDAGVEVEQEQISKAAEYKDKVQTKRHAALKLLNSTRKDKAGEKLNMVMDPSTYVASLIQQHKDTIQEGEFEEVEEEYTVVDDVDYYKQMKEGKAKGDA